MVSINTNTHNVCVCGVDNTETIDLYAMHEVSKRKNAHPYIKIYIIIMIPFKLHHAVWFGCCVVVRASSFSPLHFELISFV